MSTRWVTTACTATGLIAALSLAPPAAGQGPASGTKAAAKAPAAPRTPWGDPDLQGTWTTDSAQAIPMQRPDQFAGRAELTDEEFKAKTERDPVFGFDIVTEVPGVVRYYQEKYGRPDLQSQVLSDPKYTPSDTQPAFIILQRGRTYFENQQEMKDVKARFTLVYAKCIRGHTAAEVYAAPANPGQAVQPCGDARP